MVQSTHQNVSQSASTPTYTLRGWYFIERGVSTVIFVQSPTKELDKTQKYTGYLPWYTKTVEVFGGDVIDYEALYRN
jgi:hypothetical protein